MLRLTPLAILLFSLVVFGCNSSEEVVETSTAKKPSAESLPPDHDIVRSAEPQQTSGPDAPAESSQIQPIVLLNDPVELTLFEVPSQALLDWYKTRKNRPALILYSNDPFLQRTTPAIQKSLLSSLQQQKREGLEFARPDAAVFPEMAVDAALQSGFFSAVYWHVVGYSLFS